MMKQLLVIAATWMMMTGANAETQLLYIFADDCGACNKFQREVGDIYPKTQESDVLPMIKIELDQWRLGASPFNQCAVAEVFGTPTFILLEACVETDRITGYANDELFWLGLTRMFNHVQRGLSRSQ